MSRIEKLNKVTVDINSMYDVLEPLILSAKEIEDTIEKDLKTKPLLKELLGKLTDNIKKLVDRLQLLFVSYHELASS